MSDPSKCASCGSVFPVPHRPECVRLQCFAAPRSDPVAHPAHYQGKVECIDGIESAVEGLTGANAFNAGQVLKYVWRYHRKGKPLEDLRKARWYLDRLIAALETKP